MENHGIHLFDTIADGLESRARSAGARALVELGRRFHSPDSLARISREELAAESSRLGVGDIYLIGPDGKVMATDFEPDRGLDLFSLGGDFKAFLLSIEGKGKVETQSLSLSTRTGHINMYQYYSPPGSKVLIETSTSLRQLFAGAFPGIRYDALLSQLLDLAPPGGSGRLVWLSDIVTFGPGNYRYWSLLRDGSPSDIPADLLVEAISKGEARRAEGNREVLVRVADLDRRDVDYFNAHFLEVFSLDRRPVRDYRLICLAAGLAIAASISAISLIRARRSFAAHVTKRIDAIVQSLKSIELGSSDTVSDCSSIDEISAIGRGIYGMVTALMEKNRRLEELSSSLEDEVQEGAAREVRLSSLLEERKALLMEIHHRVRNNLQVLSSLVALQVHGAANGSVKDALDAIRARILGMSLVHDRLYESENMTTIDAGGYFGDLAHSIVELKACAGRRVAVEIDVDGIELSSDMAIPLGLAVGELIAAACDHAFADSSGGKIEVRLERDADELRVVVSDDCVGIGSAQPDLGLDIVKVLCDQLGASFRLETRSPRGHSGYISVPLG